MSNCTSLSHSQTLCIAGDVADVDAHDAAILDAELQLRREQQRLDEITDAASLKRADTAAIAARLEKYAQIISDSYELCSGKHTAHVKSTSVCAGARSCRATAVPQPQRRRRSCRPRAQPYIMQVPSCTQSVAAVMHWQAACRS